MSKSTKDEFDNIILTPKEIKLLRQLRSKKKMEISDNAALNNLLRLRLVDYTEAKEIDGFYYPCGPCALTEKGQRYCDYLKHRRRVFAAKHAWLPLLVAIAGTILSFAKGWLQL